MKQILILIALVGLTQASCNKEEHPAPNNASLNGNWRMILSTVNSSGAVITKPADITGDVDITFAATGTQVGTINGHTPTNIVGQNDYTTGVNQSLSIPELMMTKVYETTWGNEFVANIRSSQSYHFNKAGNLIIKTLNKSLSFRRLP